MEIKLEAVGVVHSREIREIRRMWEWVVMNASYLVLLSVWGWRGSWHILIR